MFQCIQSRWFGFQRDWSKLILFRLILPHGPVPVAALADVAVPLGLPLGLPLGPRRSFATWHGHLRNQAGTGVPQQKDQTQDPLVESSASLGWRLNQYLVLPIGSMYAIYGNIYHQYTPNVSIYSIHGSYGLENSGLFWVFQHGSWVFKIGQIVLAHCSSMQQRGTSWLVVLEVKRHSLGLCDCFVLKWSNVTWKTVR